MNEVPISESETLRYNIHKVTHTASEKVLLANPLQ